MAKDTILHITTHKKCNLNCVYCCEWVRKNGNLIDDVLKWYTDNTQRDERITEDLKKWKGNFYGVVFSSWEPTLNNNLEKHIALAHKLEYKKIELVTNGIRISDKQYLKRLQDAGLNSLIISVNSFDPNISRYVSWNNYDWKKTLAWIWAALQLKVPFAVNIVINKHTLISLKQTVYILHKLGVYHVLLSFIRYDGFSDKLYTGMKRIEKNAVTYEEFIKYFSENGLWEILDAVETVYFNDFPVCVLKKCSQWVGKIHRSKDFNFFDRLSWKLTELPDVWVKRRFFDECQTCVFKSKCCGIENEYFRIFWEKQVKKEIYTMN